MRLRDAVSRAFRSALVGCLFLVALSGNGTAQETSDSLAIGAASYARGDFAKAIEDFTKGVAEARALADKGLETDALSRRADAYQALGFLKQAAADLNAAIALLDETYSPE